MSFLQTYLLRMAVFLVLVAIAAAFIAPGLQDALLANVWLNGLILLILLVGIVYSFDQVLRLRGVIYWLVALRRESSGGLVFPGALQPIGTASRRDRVCKYGYIRGGADD